MNDIFNFKQFAGYTAKIYKEKGRKYLMYVILMVCIQVFTILITVKDTNTILSPLFIMWMPLILGILFVFNEMKTLRKGHSAIMNHTLPVSYFEKYLLIILNTVLACIILFLGTYIVMKLAVNRPDYWLSEEITFSQMRFITEAMVICIPIAIFAGTTNIKNHLLAFLIVTVISLPLLVSPILLPWYLSSNVFNGIAMEYMFSGLSAQVESGGTHVEYSTTPIFGKLLSSWAGHRYDFYAWAILFLVAGYFKFKERQIK